MNIELRSLQIVNKVWLRRFIFICLVIPISFSGRAQGILIKAELDTTSILIGDQIHLNFFVEQPQDAKVWLPSIKDSLAGKIEVLSELKTDTIFVGNGRLRLLKRFLITCFDSGVYEIKSFKLPFIFGTVSDSLSTTPLLLTVNTIPIKDPKKIFDIKGIMKIPYTFAEILPYIGFGIIVILLILLGTYVYIRIKNKKPIFNFIKPSEPPHITAFRELEKLKAEKLWQQGMVKQFFTRLTDILRTYIEGRFKVLALESTTEEIVLSLKDNELITSRNLSNLKQMLEVADLVKFAKAEPLPDENENSWQFAYEFVMGTYKDPEVVTEQTDIQSKVSINSES
jgi:hypothetical protein